MTNVNSGGNVYNAYTQQTALQEQAKTDSSDSTEATETEETSTADLQATTILSSTQNAQTSLSSESTQSTANAVRLEDLTQQLASLTDQWNQVLNKGKKTKDAANDTITKTNEALEKLGAYKNARGAQEKEKNRHKLAEYLMNTNFQIPTSLGNPARKAINLLRDKIEGGTLSKMSPEAIEKQLQTILNDAKSRLEPGNKLEAEATTQLNALKGISPLVKEATAKEDNFQKIKALVIDLRDRLSSLNNQLTLANTQKTVAEAGLKDFMRETAKGLLPKTVAPSEQENTLFGSDGIITKKNNGYQQEEEKLKKALSEQEQLLKSATSQTSKDRIKAKMNELEKALNKLSDPNGEYEKTKAILADYSKEKKDIADADKKVSELKAKIDKTTQSLRPQITAYQDALSVLQAITAKISDAIKKINPPNNP